jgi:hypothetical protein
MANLKEIIGSVLRDIILAQHQANLFSQSLNESYKQSGRTSGYNRPAVALGDIEMDFRYSIKEGIEETEEEDVNYPEANRYVRYIAHESAELIIKTLVKTVQKSGLDYKGNGYEFIDQLNTNRRYIRQLTKQLFAKLTVDVNNLLSADKQLDAAKIEALLLDVAEKELLLDEELKALFSIDVKADLQTTLKKAFQEAIAHELKSIIQESRQVSFRKIQRFGSLQVVVDSEELAKLPESAVQHIKINIVPQKVAKSSADDDEII